MTPATQLKHIPIHWGAATAQERGPLIVRDGNGYAKNVIGNSSGPFGIFYEIARAKGEIMDLHDPSVALARSTFVPLPRPLSEAALAAKEGAGTFDPTKLVTLDPFGFRPHEYFADLMQDGAQIKPMISATPDEAHIEGIEREVKAGTMKPDGVVVRHDQNGDVYVQTTQVSTNAVWHLPSVAKLFELSEDALREALFKGTNNPDFINRRDLEVYLPTYEGINFQVIGDIRRLSNPETVIGLRIHDACDNSDIHDSSRCTCKAYMDFAKEEGVRLARAGGVFILAQRRFEGRALGAVVKKGVYASRESQQLPDTAEFYFQHTHDYVGGEDVRLHKILGETAQLFGLKHIHFLYSMNGAKFANIAGNGTTVGMRVALPPSRVPPRAWQEVVGKVTDDNYHAGVYDYVQAARDAGFVPGVTLSDLYAGVPTLRTNENEIKLKYCAVSGVDDAVRIRDLNKLAARFPFMEVGILWYPKEAGEPRYPTRDWINRFVKTYKGQHAAIHLCGSSLGDFANGDADTVKLATQFKRVQLNLRFENAGDQINPSDLVEQIKKHPNIEFVIQYGQDQKALLPLFADVPNVSVFHDVSAGAGKLAREYLPPVEGRFTGYAGGLGPHNLAGEMARIQKVAPGQTIWVDAETNVRSENDVFDISKASQFLAVAETFVGIENRVSPEHRAAQLQRHAALRS